MNIKDLITFGITALIVTFGIQYFIGRKLDRSPDQMISGQKMTAPKAAAKIPELNNPLNREIDFVDTETQRPADITKIDTPLMELSFSSNGAVVDALSFKRIMSGIEQKLATYTAQGDTREEGIFLLGFEERTPYYYDLVASNEDTDGYQLTYKAQSDDLTVTKIFKVYKDLHKIDLTIMLDGSSARQPRLFVPGPLLVGMTSDDIVQGIMNNQQNVVQKEPRNDQLELNYWPSPTLFGVEDRYFIHALVEDPDNFALRGFYDLDGELSLAGVIEGYPLAKTDKRAWRMSFYVGPKEVDAIGAVDQRLETTLDYGFMAPISKFLLFIMKKMYEYIPNYGLVIILLTLLMRLLLLPFSFKQGRAMKSGKELQRKLAYIEQKYKHDRETLMREKAELIRKHGMPDMLGCLPVFLQIPLFWALNRVLSSSIELFRAPFLWISDLSAADPYYILPLLMALGMMLSFASAGDVKQRLPLILVSIVIGAIFANLAAGLALFIATSTWMTIAETRVKKAIGA